MHEFFRYLESAAHLGMAVTVAVFALIAHGRKPSGGWLLLAITTFIGIGLQVLYFAVDLIAKGWSFDTRMTFYTVGGVIGLGEQALYLTAIILLVRDVAPPRPRVGSSPHTILPPR